jgi:hypothetical protein
MIPGTSLLHALAVHLSDAAVNFSIRGNAHATYAVNSDGTVTINSGSFYEKWISIAASAGNYEVLATLVSGPTPSGTLNSWVAPTQSWTLSNNAQDDSTVSCQLAIQIRSRATGVVKASATVTLSATSRSPVGGGGL